MPKSDPMSENRRPSPIQPPLRPELQENMAQVQCRPSFPMSTFLGRPEPRFTSGPALPPIDATQPPMAWQHDPRSLRPMHSSSLRGPPCPSKRSSKAISIAQLVSSDPPTPGRTRSTSSIPQATYHSPAGSQNSTPTDCPPQTSTRTSLSANFSDQVSPLFHIPSSTYRAETLQYPHGQPYQYHTQSQPERHQYSPAVTSDSSYYDSHPEVSPRTSVPPAQPPPAPVPAFSEPPVFNYTLNIRQQPVAARACGFGERDRRVIDPPPILELKITEHETGAPTNDYNGMLALHCTLVGPDGKDDQTEVPPAHPDMPSTRRLMGTLVVSPYQAKDEQGIAGTFFVFPDLSCRSPGKYRLLFKLLRVDPQKIWIGARQPSVARIVSDIFSVFTAKDFPGMRASSALLKALRRQGLSVSVKKGSEARKGKGKTKKESSSDEDEDESEASEEERRGSGETGETGSTDGVSPRTKTRKRKAKRKRRDS